MMSIAAVDMKINSLRKKTVKVLAGILCNGSKQIHVQRSDEDGHYAGMNLILTVSIGLEESYLDARLLERIEEGEE